MTENVILPNSSRHMKNLVLWQECKKPDSTICLLGYVIVAVVIVVFLILHDFDELGLLWALIDIICNSVHHLYIYAWHKSGVHHNLHMLQKGMFLPEIDSNKNN